MAVNPKQHLQKLDDIRGLAAVYVIIYHLLQPFKSLPPGVKLLFSFGQEAVILFFLLSGFVIYTASCRYPKLTYKNYFIKRFRRIYFPFIIALLLSVLVFAFNGTLQHEFSFQNLISNIFMLQDIDIVKDGVWVNPFLKNYPLWSLSYEWWFYMLFFWLHNQKGFYTYKYKLYVIFLFSAFAYITYVFLPNQISLFLAYFILWWTGLTAAEIYQTEGRFTYQKLKPILICLFLMALLSAIPVGLLGSRGFGYYPFLMFRHFFFAFLVVLLGLLWYRHKLIYFDKTLAIFGIIAPISYGLYIFHFPILEQWNLTPYIPNLFVQYIIKFATLFGLAYLVEVKLQPIVNQWIK